MKLSFARSRLKLFVCIAVIAISSALLMSSSHREAPLISDDPLADNTDLYAFRSPNLPNKVIIIANYIPGQLPQGGPNYYSFGENIRYEIHIDNNVATKGDDIIYRFTFKKTNEDPTTFFYARLGKQNHKTTYMLQRSMDGGKSFETIINNGAVPPYNVGPRTINSAVGLSLPDYNTVISKSIKMANTGERVFAGYADDPFFVDLGGIFDLGDAPRQTGKPIDGLKCLNVSTLALEIDISTLQKDHKQISQAANILDPNYVIGVWASASRQKIRVLTGEGTEKHEGPWIQVSRLGMPLTNEAVIPVGKKDLWNAITPYQDLDYLSTFGKYFYRPELALYMDDDQFGKAVPAFSQLRIQEKSLGLFNFSNEGNGAYDFKGDPELNGSALDDAIFGKLLLPAPNSPRSVDLWPIFHTGVPNLKPYQLATGKKDGNPIAEGKPFINNFLPNGGDMLRLNMATPVTPRNSADFSSLGLIKAAVLGLTDPRFNTNKDLQFIPNMDGFPNGRRLEDDVTRIELQAVGGVVLAACGLWYDDYTPGSPNPVTQDLVNVLSYTTGVEANDVPLKTDFPYVQAPFAGTHVCDCADAPKAMPSAVGRMNIPTEMGMSAPEVMMTTAPNPMRENNTLQYRLREKANVQIVVQDMQGRPIKVLLNKQQNEGTYTVNWNARGLANGTYFISIRKNGALAQSLKLIKN